MSTLIEIENAVASLPPSQQRSLLVWLQSVVATVPARETKPGGGHDSWLQRLVERRERGRTGKIGTPLQQIMDDLRGN